MLKYLTKLAMEIFPSVVATILGAYIVNHYIANRPAAEPPAASSTEGKKVEAKADPKNGVKSDTKTDSKTDVKPAEASTEVANIPELGVKAKGIAEKAILGKAAVDSAYEKALEKPADGVTVVTEPRRSTPSPTPPREKAVAKTQPTTSAPVASVPAVTAPAPVETAAVPDEHEQRAAELARAAIERLRGTSGGNEAPRPQETARAPEAPRVQDVPRTVVAAPAVRPLPPPITLDVPGTPGLAAAPLTMNPPYTSSVRIDDPMRPIPPADIPTALPPPSRPLDLHADAKTVAEDMLSAAKSMFHAVLPK
jgi:hypothetical protein